MGFVRSPAVRQDPGVRVQGRRRVPAFPEAEAGERGGACAPRRRHPHTASGEIDYSKDFFGKAAFLTVSSQLTAEYYACSLTSVYTFGPTFRAENSHTARHLAEFWMIEPEIAFADLADDMRCAEDYVRFCCRWLLDNAAEDMAFINNVIDKTAVARLEKVASSSFVRLSYTEAVRVLEEHVATKKKKFEFPVSWGVDLQVCGLWRGGRGGSW